MKHTTTTQRLLALFFASLVLALSLTSCHTVQYVPITSQVHDTVKVVSLQHDSILTRDTFMLDRYRQGDTVFVTRNVVRYRDRVTIRHDTIYRAKTDTTQVAVKVAPTSKAKPYTPSLMKLLTIIAAIVLICLYLNRKQNQE